MAILRGVRHACDRSARIVDSEAVYSGWVSLVRAAVCMPDGAIVERHIEDHGNAIAVLPYDPDRRCALLVSMPRAPVIHAGEADLLEAIAGRLEDETAEDCALREALEEAGVHLRALEKVGHYWSMPSQSLERVHYFLAPFSESDRIGPGGGVPHESENVTPHELALSALPDMICDGRIGDLKTIVLVQALRLRMPHLFVARAPGLAG